jgi:hypothetical protein
MLGVWGLGADISWNLRILVLLKYPVIVAAPCVRTLVCDLQLRISWFNQRSFRVGFVVNKMVWEQTFLWVFRSFPCQCHSTKAPHSFIHPPQKLYTINNDPKRYKVCCPFQHFHIWSVQTHGWTNMANLIRTFFLNKISWAGMIMTGKSGTGGKGRISGNFPLWIGPSDSGTDYLQKS